MCIRDRGSYYGFQEFGVCLEGQTYHIPRGNFDLRVDKFWIDYHENGSVKSYNSTLTVIDQGTPTTTKTITVNDPLVYKGIWFYQSSYGDAWDQIEAARINIKEKGSDKIIATVDLEWNKEKAVDGDVYKRQHLGCLLIGPATGWLACPGRRRPT